MAQSKIDANLAAVDAHFHNEASNEVDKALELYTEDIVWEAPGMLLPDEGHRLYEGKPSVADNYRKLFASMANVEFHPVQRFATEDRVVDDSVVTFDVVQEGYYQFPIRQKVEMRLAHIFEIRDGKISREIAYTMEHAA